MINIKLSSFCYRTGHRSLHLWAYYISLYRVYCGWGNLATGYPCKLPYLWSVHWAPVPKLPAWLDGLALGDSLGIPMILKVGDTFWILKSMLWLEDMEKKCNWVISLTEARILREYEKDRGRMHCIANKTSLYLTGFFSFEIWYSSSNRLGSRFQQLDADHNDVDTRANW